MAYFIMDSKRAAYDESGSKNVVKVQVDSSSDLPNPVPDNWAPGSVCWDVSTGDIYGLNSLGLWNKQGSGGGSATLIEKTITENDTYNASDDGADGYSSVTVEVPSGSEALNVTLTVDGAFNVTEASETFSTVFQKVVDGDYVKFTFSIPDEGSSAAAGYFLSQNNMTHENEALMIVFQATIISNKNAAICIKWYSDNTFSSIMELDEIEM